MSNNSFGLILKTNKSSFDLLSFTEPFKNGWNCEISRPLHPHVIYTEFIPKNTRILDAGNVLLSFLFPRHRPT